MVRDPKLFPRMLALGLCTKWRSVEGLFVQPGLLHKKSFNLIGAGCGSCICRDTPLLKRGCCHFA
jgi:hypothetical protein